MSLQKVKVWLFFSLLFLLILIGCSKKNPVKRNPYVPRIAKAYITTEYDSVSVIDLGQFKRIKKIPVGEISVGIAITPDYNYAYVTCRAPGEVYKVKVNGDTTVGSIKVGGYPGGIVIPSDGKKAYVANTGPDSKSIAVINLKADTVETTIGLGESSPSIALTPDDSKIFVTQPAANAIWVIDAQSYTVIDQIGLDTPAYIAISRDGSYAYVTSGNSNYISQISLSTLTQTHSFQVGDYPMGMVENPVNGDLLVPNRIPNSYLGNIIALDSSFVAQDTIRVAGFPTAMAFSEDETSLWVTVGVSGGTSLLYSIDPADYTTKGSLGIECGWPMDLAVVPGESGGEPAQESP